MVRFFCLSGLGCERSCVLNNVRVEINIQLINSLGAVKLGPADDKDRRIKFILKLRSFRPGCTYGGIYSRVLTYPGRIKT